MTSPQSVCPECGRPIAHGDGCRACGDDSAVHPDAVEWLDVGDHFNLTLDHRALDRPLLGLEADTSCEITLELEMVELWESFEDRRVLLARIIGWDDGSNHVGDEVLYKRLETLELVIEQEFGHLPGLEQVLPDDFKRRVRRPVARQRLEMTTLEVFHNDGGLALDEMVEVAVGQLNLEQIRALFSPILDAVAMIHARGLVHLRLSPWTLRMRQQSNLQGIPLAFLREVMHVEETNSSAELGEDDTFSEVLPASSGRSHSALEEDSDVEFTAEPGNHDDNNPFAAARELEKTRDDISPAMLVEFAEPQLASTSASHAQSLRDASNCQTTEQGGALADDEQTAAESSRPADSSCGAGDALELLFDGVDGFLRADSSLERIPFTRGFSAPELLSQPPATQREACDIFSLGMLLYFLVAGQVAPVSIYTRQTPAIPARNLRPGFPPGLQSVIGRATRPDPSERFPSVEAFKKAFERACDVMEARRQASSAMPPRAFVAADTHTGVGKRRRNPVNQDSVFAESSDDQLLSLIVVADGVSTASFGSGDLASSALTAEAKAAWPPLLDAYAQGRAINPRLVIQELLNRVNQRIVEYVNTRFSPFHGAPHEVMGTTALVAIILDGVVTLASLGDSRVYLSRGEAFEQLTTDHNLWTLSILDGVAADSALAMPHGDALARCLGTFVVRDERLHALDPEPDVMCFELIRGDTLLLTTDGLVDFAAAHMLTSEDFIHNVLVSEPDPALACLELILLANRGGGGDNIGVAIARFI